jgi:hypothetical protein
VKEFLKLPSELHMSLRPTVRLAIVHTVIPSNNLQHRRTVLNSPSYWASMIKRSLKTEAPCVRYQSPGRLIHTSPQFADGFRKDPP